MVLEWIAVVLLLLAPINLPDHFRVESNGKMYALIDRTQYSIPLSGVPLVDPDKLVKLTQRLQKELFKPPVNATIDDHGKILPEREGVKLHQNVFLEHFYTCFYDPAKQELQMPLQSIPPKVNQLLLAELRKKTVGGYVTYYNSRDGNRAHNIFLAAKAVNNYVLFPEETFSFNKVVGERTKAKGYREAPIIVKGELSEGIGGGICQVSSTLFNAVDRAGLRILKRYSHSREVPYVPPGRDATVSWYGPDLVFQNQYAYPVLIRAKSQQGRVVITVHSVPQLQYEPRDIPSMNYERAPLY